MEAESILNRKYIFDHVLFLQSRSDVGHENQVQ